MATVDGITVAKALEIEGKTIQSATITGGNLIITLEDNTTINAGPALSPSDLTTHANLTATHGATGAVVGTTNTQTLSGKTLTSPTITAPTVTGGASLQGAIVIPASSTFRVNDMAPVVSRTLTNWSSASTTLIATGVQAVVKAPPSGIIKVEITARASNEVQGETSHVAFEVTGFQAASDSYAVSMTSLNPFTLSLTDIVTGLTAGTNYTVKIFGRTSDPGAINLATQLLIVTPQI